MSTITEQTAATKLASKKTAKLTVEEIRAGLKASQRDRLDKAVENIKRSDAEAAKSGALAYDAFAKKVAACAEMSELLGDNFRAYALEKLGYRKSHGHRLVQAGLFLKRASPRGDARRILVSEAHIRPLTGLTDADQDTVVETLKI